MIIRQLGDEWNSANGINNFWHCDKTLTFDKFGVMSASDTIIKQTFCSFERKLAESFKIVNIFSLNGRIHLYFMKMFGGLYR